MRTPTLTKPDAASLSARIADAGLIALALLYAATKLALRTPPLWLSVCALVAAAALVGLWVMRQLRPPGRGLLAWITASWPAWAALVWSRELTAHHQLIDLALLSGLSCSVCLRLAEAITRRPVPLWCKRQEFLRRLSWSFCGLFTVIFTVQPWLRYNAFYTYWMDLGFMIQPIWNTAHGRLFELTMLDGSIGSSLADHFSPIFLLLAPFVRIAPSPATLFFVQALACGIGGVILFHLVNRHAASPVHGLVFQAAYYLYAPLQFGVLGEFHADPLCVPLLFVMLAGFEWRRWWMIAAGFAASLICKEHIGLMIAPLLAVMALRHAPWRRRLAVLALAACAYSLLAETVFIPLANGGRESMSLTTTFPGGNEGGLLNVAATVAAHPWRIARLFGTPHNAEQLVWLLLPLLYLPLGAMTEALALSLMLLKEFFGGFSVDNHHQAYMAPLLFWCVLTVWRRFPEKQRRLIAVALCLNCLLIGFVNGESVASHRFWRTLTVRYLPSAHAGALRAALAAVPAGASVSADSHIAAHLFDRERICLFPTPFPGDSTDYVVVDTVKRGESAFEIRAVTWGSRTRAEIMRRFEALRQGGGYETIFEQNGVTVLRRMGRRAIGHR